MKFVEGVRVFIIGLLIIGCFQLALVPSKQPGDMIYTRYGENASEIIIAFHGSPGDKSDFRTLGPALADTYTFYALDLPCFGEQGLMKVDCGIDGAADGAAQFMEEQRIERAHLLGYSWGGGAALDFAARYPEKTKTLILLDSMGIPEGEMTGSYELERARMYLSYPFVLYYPGAFGGSHSWREGFMRSYRETDLRTIRSSLASIEAPTLVLHGSHDTVVEPWVAEEHARLLSQGELYWYDGTHVTVFSNVTEISPAIRSFLASHSPKGAKATVSLTIDNP